MQLKAESWEGQAGAVFQGKKGTINTVYSVQFGTGGDEGTAWKLHSVLHLCVQSFICTH